MQYSVFGKNEAIILGVIKHIYQKSSSVIPYRKALFSSTSCVCVDYCITSALCHDADSPPYRDVGNNNI